MTIPMQTHITENYTLITNYSDLLNRATVARCDALRYQNEWCSTGDISKTFSSRPPNWPKVIGRHLSKRCRRSPAEQVFLRGRMAGAHCEITIKISVASSPKTWKNYISVVSFLSCVLSIVSVPFYCFLPYVPVVAYRLLQITWDSFSLN